jgi:hypothetical protein
MSIEFGLGVRASDLENEQLANVKKVANMKRDKLVSKTRLTLF